MSKSKPTPGDTAMLTFACPRCGAPPLVWCSYPTGRPSFYLHSWRFYLTADKNGRLPQS